MVTVIIPTFDRVDLLMRAIDSVLAQTFTSWEIVVVDDESPHDVDAIVQRVRDPRVRCVRRAVNGGVAAAQNTGIDHARGEFLVFLHTDDELLPEKLQLQVDLITQSPTTVGAVESGAEVVWPDRLERWPALLEGADAFDVLSYRAGAHVAGLLVRRTVADEIRFDEQLRGAEDRDFCVRLLRHSSVRTSSATLSRIWKREDRLGLQDKGPAYLHLLEKYRDTIAADHRVHADWEYRIAQAHARVGRVADARRALRRSMQIDPGRSRRWFIWLASFGDDRLFASALRTQVHAAAAVQFGSRRLRALARPGVRGWPSRTEGTGNVAPPCRAAPSGSSSRCSSCWWVGWQRWCSPSNRSSTTRAPRSTAGGRRSSPTTSSRGDTRRSRAR